MLLSVIIVSYNSKHVLEACLKHLKRRLDESLSKDQAEIIVVDNHSEPSELAWLKKQSGIRLAFLDENIGFGRANNVGLGMAKGEYVLFLNSDVNLVEPIDFQELVNFLAEQDKAAGLTVKVILPTGGIDPASHRGFPTPTNALAYFSGLEKLTAGIPGLNRLFGGYHLVDRDLNTVHEIDSPTAAFFLVKKKVVDHLGGFDPDYFFYGEDLDLCYRIKKLGYSIWYYPRFLAVHLKYQSSQKSRRIETAVNARTHFFKTMGTFVDKHYRSRYPWPIYALVKAGISLMARIKA